jgi:hypothetical protein
VQIVGSVLVRNEDVFVEQAIRNVASFCDRIHALDHRSSDRTCEILRALARELDHLELERSSDAGRSHRRLDRYAGTPTWIVRVDGDELYDPAGLARFRETLLGGAHADVFELKAHVLHCESLDRAAGVAQGFLAPPSRAGTKLFNFAAIERWRGGWERLHGPPPVFRPGYGPESWRTLADETTWDSDPLRALHLCFVRRSSLDQDDFASGRRNLMETGMYRRGFLGTLRRAIRRPLVSEHIKVIEARGDNWKRDKYRRGERVSVDARPFFRGPARA